MRLITDQSLRNRTEVFRDRVHAARILTQKLESRRDELDLVLAIPSGGVPVGYTISADLGIPLDLIIVRKAQIPWQPEAGFGSVTSAGEVYLNERLIETLNLSEETIERSIEVTKEEIKRRNEKFRRDTAFPEIETKTVALVDDGIASGYTMLAAVQSVRARYPSRILVAVPTASDRSLEMLEEPVDEMICPNIRSQTFYAVADAYEEWHDLSDGEVLRYLRRAGIIEA